MSSQALVRASRNESVRLSPFGLLGGSSADATFAAAACPSVTWASVTGGAAGAGAAMFCRVGHAAVFEARFRRAGRRAGPDRRGLGYEGAVASGLACGGLQLDHLDGAQGARHMHNSRVDTPGSAECDFSRQVGEAWHHRELQQILSAGQPTFLFGP